MIDPPLALLLAPGRALELASGLAQAAVVPDFLSPQPDNANGATTAAATTIISERRMPTIPEHPSSRVRGDILPHGCKRTDHP
ncbi:hypothetical protein GCM10010172_10060 [Paractinoplanes ferrugineus]|uniref:Uncharacterized protein n=1 Tax=Paractinoplanes ferrugineus TaxID=113564 RepID=A0A919MEI7_9ACTN|nr:hypothetical protein Afe05nite_14100 [Actinoplanes ferrugineus]